ncbi:conjugal transfer protein [Rhodococcus erythropolis]|uniref:conjugal transfer protein n=2 Tax=Rhodococcus erythropolis group TaxID=2840174 RepID=UPI002225CFDC|nr:conjugal transfer protein [Rhodococcus erythropolis]MCW2295311.1 hypothetical protein [Rhodococcus erythropolis]
MSRFKGMKRKPHTDKVVLEDNEPQSEQATWARTQDRKTQVVRFGLFGAIGAGVLALVLVLSGFTVSSPTVMKPKSTASVNTAAQAQAEDLAQQFVVTWLQAKRGAEKTLAPYVRAEGIRLPSEALFVASDARVASVEIQPAPTSPVATSGTGAPVSNTSSVYSVVVSASVRQASEPSEAAQRRFYSVPVVVNDGSARAASIPSPVPAPATGPDVNLGYKYRIVAGHPSNTAVQQFLAALTAGTGEISRYIAPGTSLRAISPAPYKSVKVVDLVSDRDFSGEAADKAPADGNQDPRARHCRTICHVYRLGNRPVSAHTHLPRRQMGGVRRGLQSVASCPPTDHGNQRCALNSGLDCTSERNCSRFSYLRQLTSPKGIPMSTTALLLDPNTHILAEGILELVNNKGTEAQDTIRILTGAGACGGVAFTAVKSRFSLAPILLAGLVAGLLVWLVWNVTAVKDKVGSELESMGHSIVVDASETPTDLLGSALMSLPNPHEI